MFHYTGTRAWTLVPSPQSFAVNCISQKQASCLTPLRCMNNKVKQEPYKTDRHYRERTHGGTSVQVLLQPTCWAGGISQAMQSCNIIANPPVVSSNGSRVIKAGLAGDRFLSTVFTLCWLKPWRGSSSSDQKERRTRASGHVLTWRTLGFRTGTMHLAVPPL